MTTKSSTPEIVKVADAAIAPAQTEVELTTGATFVAESGLGWNLYLTSGRFVMRPVNRATKKVRTAEQVAATPKYGFASVNPDGTEVEFSKYNLTAAEMSSYLDSADDADRAQVLSGIEPDRILAVSSAIKPNPDRLPVMDRAGALDATILAGGTLFVPKSEDRGGSKSRASSRKLSAEEQTAAMLAEVRASFAAPAPVEPEVTPPVA